MIFGVTGFNASGKGEFCNYLAAKGFLIYSLSDILREELKKEGKELTRENLIAKGNELRHAHGSSVLAKMTAQKIMPGKNYVIDSIRNPEEALFLKKNKEFTLVFIDAPLELRFKRAKDRNREKEALTFEDFKSSEEKELSSSDSAGQQLIKCRELADNIIINNSTKDSFHEKIDRLLE